MKNCRNFCSNLQRFSADLFSASLPTQHCNLTILLRRRTAVFQVLQVSNFITAIPSEWQKLCWVPCLHQWSSLEGQAWIVRLQLCLGLLTPSGKKLELSIHVSSLHLSSVSSLAFRFPSPSICFLSSRRLQKIPLSFYGIWACSFTSCPWQSSPNALKGKLAICWRTFISPNLSLRPSRLPQSLLQSLHREQFATLNLSPGKDNVHRENCTSWFYYPEVSFF